MYLKKKSVLAIVFFLFCMSVFGNDSTYFAIQKKRNFGMSFGTSYSILKLDASPYFKTTGNGLGRAEAKNSLGMNVGFFWYAPVKEKVSMRFALEANILQSHLIYDTGNINKEKSLIFPLTIEMPIAFIYGKHYRNDVTNKGTNQLGYMVGIRPSIPITLFSDPQPKLKNFNLNFDFGISRPVALKKAILRAELIFSLGLLNIIGEEQDNYKTNSIQYLGRSFIGLRMYFN